MIRCIDLAFFL